MSCISVPYFELCLKPEVAPSYFGVLRAAINRVVNPKSSWEYTTLGEICMVPRVKHFNSLNIISVSDVNSIDDMVIYPESICLPDQEFVDKFSEAIKTATGDWTCAGVYKEIVFQAYPMLERCACHDIPGAGNRDDLVRIYFFDVVSLDHNHMRLTFLTKQDAQNALDMMKGAL